MSAATAQAAIYGYDIVVTHKNGRSLGRRRFTWTNERNERMALRALKRARAENPQYRFVLLERWHGGRETVREGV